MPIKHLEANVKHLLRMEMVTGVLFLSLSSVNKDIIFYLLATVVGYEIRSVGTSELRNIPCISAGLPVRSMSVIKKAGCSDSGCGF